MSTSAIRRHKTRNSLHTLLLVGSLASLMSLSAWLIGGPTLALLALTGVVLVMLIGTQASPWIALRLHGARPLAHHEGPRVHEIIHELAERAGLDRPPALHVFNDREMNAFAAGTGRRSALAVSVGLLRNLNSSEVAGVLAHEISHIANGDVRVMRLADLAGRITGSFAFFGQFLLLLNLPLLLFGAATIHWGALLVLIAAPTVGLLIRLALSRTREFDADRGAVELLGSAKPLVSALIKMERQRRWGLGEFWSRTLRRSSDWNEGGLLRTHPPLVERVRRLYELGGHGAPGRLSQSSFVASCL